LRRQPGGLRGRARRDRDDGSRGPGRAGPADRRGHAAAAARAGREVPGHRRRPRPRRDAGYRADQAGDARPRPGHHVGCRQGLPPGRAGHADLRDVRQRAPVPAAVGDRRGPARRGSFHPRGRLRVGLMAARRASGRLGGVVPPGGGRTSSEDARRQELTRLVMAAQPTSFWLDSRDAPAVRAPLRGEVACDLAVVGGGFGGLWAALLAKEANPGRSVVLIEGSRIGWAASGRNGGFCDASLTHGAANGRERFPAEFETLERLGTENLDAIEAATRHYGFDCEFERTGTLAVATEDYQVAELREAAAADGVKFLDAAAVRAEVDSPTYLAGSWDAQGTAMVHPARLAWGLAAACERIGVRIAERTPATGLASDADGVTLRTRHGVLRARRAVLATNAFPSLVKRLRPYIVPVYDYVLLTEPLTAAQLASVAWRNRQGVADSGNQFHYYRLTADNRILWGGYDAIYHFGRVMRSSYDQRPETFTRLAEHFFATFPQLEGI